MKIGILGRTNVGKSTLFNRLIGTHRAIVTDVAGTTRELLTDDATIDDQHFIVVDSPGLDSFEEEKPFLKHIVEDCDILLFVVDNKQEIGKHDREITSMIQQENKMDKTILVVNKLDSKVYSDEVYSLIADRYQLGFEHIVPVSAKHAEGLESVRETIVILANQIADESGEEQDEYESTENYLPIAILGKPNAGKSTLINTLSGEWISEVAEEAGTTLDYITTTIEFQGRSFVLYDTAGVRRKGKTKGLEKIAYEKTHSLLEYKKPTVIFVVDLEAGFTKRDGSLLNEIQGRGVPVVLTFNKIDTMSKEESRRRIKTIRDRFPYLKDYYHIGISAEKAINLPQMMKLVEKVHQKRTQRIPTGALNKLLTKAWLLSPPRFPKNKVCKRKYITQVNTKPPTFMLSVNNVENANFSFKKWIKNVLRTEGGLHGVPIHLEFSSKKEDNPYTE